MAGPTEWIIILVIVILLFGAKKLPDLASSMGKSIREFRKASEDADADDAEAEAGTTGNHQTNATDPES